MSKDIADLADGIKDTAPPNSYTRNYKVSVVTPGASLDGKAQVYIKVGADDLPVPYLDSYLTPAVNDIVQVQFSEGSPTIQGRVIGLPNI